MLQGVLFDMDGILFDTERIYAEIEIEMLTKMGHTVPSDLYTKICGANAVQVRQVFLQAFGQDFDYTQFAEDLHAEVERQNHTGMPKMPGVDDTLAYLKQNGYTMAIASSSGRPIVLRNLQRGNIQHYFSAIITGDMIQNSKPAPDIFMAAAKELGLAPQNCLAVEDSINGVNSALAAGCVTVMVPDMLPPTPDIEQRAAAILKSLSDIPAFLQNYNSANP